MPSAAPYDTLEDVLNTARVRVNDAIQQLQGDILTDTAVFTLTYITAAWRRFQQILANYGISIMKRDKIILDVPAATQTDYGTQVWFDWDGFFDGTTFQSAPVVPPDLIFPLDLWERVHGNTQTFFPMDQPENGLSTVEQTNLDRQWEWRDNKIFMPGATGTTDIRLRYMGFLPDFVDAGTTPFNAQFVPIVNALSPFAYFICCEFSKSRGDLDAGQFDQLAIAETRFIFDRDPQQGKSIFKRSEYGKMVVGDTPLEGPAGPRGPQLAVTAKGR